MQIGLKFPWAIAREISQSLFFGTFGTEKLKAVIGCSLQLSLLSQCRIDVADA